MNANDNELPDEVSQSMVIMEKAYGNMLREGMGLDESWAYRPLPWMNEEFYIKFLDIVGEDNIQITTLTRRTGTVDGESKSSVRASVFLNEQGLENLRSYSDVQS